MEPARAISVPEFLVRVEKKKKKKRKGRNVKTA
jgi:hypothetical protein